MFERFTESARQVVVVAQEEGRRLRSDHIGTEHLLLGLLEQPDSRTAALLRRHGLSRDAVVAAVRASVGSEGLDADALASVGIDLEAVRSSVEATFGPGALDTGSPERRRRGLEGHLPFTPRAKKVLELSLRECLARKDRSITEAHIALGLIREGQGLAMKVICDHGIDPRELRREIGQAPAA